MANAPSSPLVLINRAPAPPTNGFAAGRSVALHAHRHAHAAADAQRRKALPGVAPLHLEQQGVEDTGARGADRMADGDGAAVDVDLLRVPAKTLVDRAGLGGEGLVRLDQVEVLDGPTGLLQRL